jgi:hypothetical protein
VYYHTSTKCLQINISEEKSNFDAKSCGKICKRANVHRIFAAFLGIMMINEGTKYCRIEKTCVPLQPISGNRKLTILLT